MSLRLLRPNQPRLPSLPPKKKSKRRSKSLARQVEVADVDAVEAAVPKLSLFPPPKNKALFLPLGQAVVVPAVEDVEVAKTVARRPLPPALNPRT